MTTHHASAVLALSGALVLAGAAGGDMTFAELAPPQSVFVAGVDDFAAAQTAFERTGFNAVLQAAEVREWIEESTRDAMDDFTDLLDELDTDFDDLAMPTGMAGVAFWVVKTEDETTPPLHIIKAADFGDEVDAMHDLFINALAKAEDEGDIRYDDEAYAGATIYTIEQIEDEDAADAANDDEDDWDDWDEDWDDSPDFRYTTFHYARRNSVLLGSTDLRALENAIDALAGDDIESAFDSPDFARSRGMIGRHHAYAVVLNAPFYRLAAQLDRENADDEFAEGPAIMEILDATGLAEVRAAAAGVLVDGDRGMAESTLAVLVPERRGIMSLFDAPAASFEPPAFVGPDVAGVSMIQVRFDQLLQTVSEIANNLPAEDAAGIQMGLGQATLVLGPILNQLENRVYISATYTKPFSPTSQRTLIALKAKDSTALAQAFGMLVQQFAAFVPLESDEFQGNQIWSLPEGAGGGMMPVPGLDQIAIGIGAGYLFVGQNDDVRSALRQAGAAGDVATLAAEESFNNAAQGMPARGLSFTYTDTEKSIDYYSWMLDNWDTIVDHQVEQAMASFPDDMPNRDEMRDMFREQMGGSLPEWVRDIPTLDIIREHVGDSIGWFELTDDGIVGYSITLEP